MFVYYRIMRIKDENKKEAIFEATIKLINEIGFSNISMAKIAKVAGVSPSTLYIYYENKEDMFRKVYIDAKSQMFSACNKGIERDESVELSIKKMCRNLLKFMKEREQYFLFVEQSSNSPLISAEINKDIMGLTQELLKVFERGIEQGIFKDISPMLLIAFCISPITQIYKACCKQMCLEDIDYEVVFQMCLDAIKK